MVPSMSQVQLAKEAGRLTASYMHAESALSTSGKRLADRFGTTTTSSRSSAGSAVPSSPS